VRVVEPLHPGEPGMPLGAETRPNPLVGLVDRGVVAVAGAGQRSGRKSVDRATDPGDLLIVLPRVLPDAQRRHVPAGFALPERGSAVGLAASSAADVLEEHERVAARYRAHGIHD